MREIHMVMMMRIIFCTRRIVNGSLGRPKNLLPFCKTQQEKEDPDV
jgi:hypothetical protein